MEEVLAKTGYENMRFGGNGTEVTVVKLSVRQLQVLNLVVRGLSNKEIAQSLRMAPSTVRTHLDVLYRELGQRNRTALATWAGARPGVLESGVAVVGAHPPGCGCGFSYCPFAGELTDAPPLDAA